MQICLVIWILIILLFTKMTHKYFIWNVLSECKTGYNEWTCMCQWKVLKLCIFVKRIYSQDCCISALYAPKSHVLLENLKTFILLLTIFMSTYHKTAAITSAPIFFLLSGNLTHASLHLVNNHLKKRNLVFTYFILTCAFRIHHGSLILFSLLSALHYKFIVVSKQPNSYMHLCITSNLL